MFALRSKSLERRGLIFLLAIPLLAEDAPQPAPDFSQAAIAAAAAEMPPAWEAWRASDRNLEQEVFTLPMGDSRIRVQAAFSGILNYLEKRGAYSEAVLQYVKNYRPENAALSTVVGASVVSADQIQLLGVNVAIVSKKLEALREWPDWTQIRRGVRADLSEILELQDSRRGDMQVTLSISRRGNNVRPVSPIVYQDTERQTREALERLWTHYYQALADSVERKPGGSSPLVASSTPPPAAVPVPVPVPENPAGKLSAKTRNLENPFVGAWTYADGSQQFNGVAEPRQVVLELWMDKGLLVGRYRAQLPDFNETKRVDLALHGKPQPGQHAQTLEFQSTNPAATGKIVLEPGSTGLDLMLVREVEAGSAVPRGRELLTRR